MLHYFAYGSNLYIQRLQRRTPSCLLICKAVLSRHQLRFHKMGRDGSAKCDAYETGRPSDRVEGVVYRLDRSELSALDRAEDLGVGYDAYQVEVETPQGLLKARTYIARHEAIDASLRPFGWYHAFVMAGARQHGLTEAYLDQISQIPCRRDPDRNRAERNRAILDL